MDIEEKLKRIKDKSGKTLYTHLTNIVSKMMIDQCQNPCDEFVRYSEQLREAESFEGVLDEEMNLIREDGKALEPRIGKLREFFNLTLAAGEGDEPKESETAYSGDIQDLLDINTITKKCGVSLGEEEVLILQRSIRLFAARYKLSRVHFWGKVFGSHGNYWVVETSAEGAEGFEEVAGPHEPAGSGVNAHYFWAATDLVEGNWQLLPLISARQLNQARRLKYAFCGDFNRQITASPPFDGLEKHYVFSTAEVPSGPHPRGHRPYRARRLCRQARRG